MSSSKSSNLPKASSNHGITDYAILILSLTLFGYTSLRAYTLSFTHNEGITYIGGILPGLANIISLAGEETDYVQEKGAVLIKEFPVIHTVLSKR